MNSGIERMNMYKACTERCTLNFYPYPGGDISATAKKRLLMFLTRLIGLNKVNRS